MFASSLLLLIGAAACGGASTSERFEASPDARRYPLEGVVRAVRTSDRALSIAHQPIVGLMDAMTMDFVVKEPWVLDVAAAGDRVSATLVLDGARSWIEGVALTKADSEAPSGAVMEDGAGVQVVPPGTPLPEVALLDQDGRAVSPATYEGRHAVYTFIYTRCPLPDYCPLMMRRLNEVAARLEAQGRRDDVWLLAVTLDPAFDRPPVLKAFGDRTIDTDAGDDRYARTALLTGTPEDIRRLASTFQLTYEGEGEEIVHGLRTVVVDPQGRVVRTFRGNDWQAGDVLDALAFS